jgi:hypothetical protein
VIRVFPRRTNWTPNDELSFIGSPPLFRPLDQSVKISVTFTWDLPRGERLYHEWKQFYSDVEIGGPALGQESGEFESGRFVKKGTVFTSRGCPNRCWFCSVWRREPKLKELEIKEGWNVADDNILACSDDHFLKVCKMLKKQSESIIFSGGLEAARLTPWHVGVLSSIKPKRLYFAYDTPNDYEPLVEAGKLLLQVFTRQSHILCAYILIGYLGDSFTKAERRLRETMDAGFVPMAMLWRNENGKHNDREWLKFQKHWARPRLIYQKPKDALERWLF